MQAYNTLLDGIHGMGMDVPTMAALAAYFPYLSLPQLRHVVSQINTQTGKYMPAPTILISNGYHMIHVKLCDRRRFWVRLAYTKRTAESYIVGPFRDATPPEDLPPYAQEAMDYAQRTWGSSLVQDHWIAVANYHICDPRTPHFRGYTGHVMTLLAAMQKDCIYGSGHAQDDAISLVVHDPVQRQEMRGRRIGCRHFLCALCGGSLTLKACTRCKTPVDDGVDPEEWEMPLPQKVKKAMEEQGHVFAFSTSGVLRKRRSVVTPSSRETRGHRASYHCSSCAMHISFT